MDQAKQLAQIVETHRTIIARIEAAIEETKQIIAGINACRHDREFAGCVPAEQRERLRLNQRCELAFIDAAFHVYRVPTDVSKIYDGGVEIPIVAECQEYDDLRCMKIPAGHCAIVRGPVGLARLATPPVFQVTCDGSEMRSEAELSSGAEVVHDGIRMIYDSGWLKACGRGLFPNVTPGEFVELYGQPLMVTEIANDLVFFEPIEPKEPA